MSDYNRNRFYRTALDRKMEGIVRRRGGFDPRTDAVISPPTKEEKLAKFAKLPSCSQPMDGPCQYHQADQDDKRCSIAARMDVCCPYKGAVKPLQRKILEEEKKKRDQDLVYEPPPEVDL